ncbi:MAG: D-glycero-alpha-D-manno-heptose-1,7-bisphosphate 7-phosphatase [Promethearchaeota archaeon]
MKNKAIFLDRDGAINEDIGYNFSIDNCKILPGVIEGLKQLKGEYKFFIITNQVGIGLGLTTLSAFKEFNTHILKTLERDGIAVEKTYYCPHIPEDNCSCRKPKTKFIKEAKEDFKIDLKQSWMIGDHPSDILLGINAGCKTTYVLTGHGEKHLQELKNRGIVPTIIARYFLEATYKIIEGKKKK